MTDHRQTITVPDLTNDEQGALDELVLQWRAKRPRNNLRAAFYDMKNSTHALMGTNVPRVVRRRQFVLGWSAIAVDKLNRRCNLEPEGFYEQQSDTDLESLGLPDLLESNRLLGELSQAGVSSLVHGVAWLVTTQGDTDAGEPPVLVLARDATTSTGMWDVRRRAVRSFLSITGTDDNGEPTSMALYLHDLNVLLNKVDGRWTVERREHSWGVPVDPLRYGARLGRPFGRSRISRAVMSIHGQALAAMIRADVNGEAYSLPRYVLLGATEEAFKNADGSSRPVWQAAWDAVWAIGDDDTMPDNLARADVKQFTGQSPEPQNAHLRMLAQMFAGETGIPVGELGIIGDANPTSEGALSVSKEDLVAEAEQTMDGWAPDMGSAIARALAMWNDDPSLVDTLRPRPRWRSPMYTSRAAAADAGTKVLTMMPWLADTEVGMELVGLTPDQRMRATSERRRAQARQTLASLRGAADALPG